MRAWVLVILLAFSGNALAQESCQQVFFSPLKSVQAQAEGRYLNSANVAEYRGLLQKHAELIFKENMKSILFLKWGSFKHIPKAHRDQLMKVYRAEAVKKDLESGVLRIEIKNEIFLKTSHMHLFQVALMRGSQIELGFTMQSNGQVSFLATSYIFRVAAPTRYTGVYQTATGIKKVDVSDLVLESLPEKIQLSRVMESTERERWLDGKMDELGSEKFNKKVHFALNYYPFMEKNPYFVQIPKEVLQTLLLEKKLEINTYEGKEENPKFGMPQAAQTSLGVRIEIVFTKEALPVLQPYMSESLRQTVLPLGPDLNL